MSTEVSAAEILTRLLSTEPRALAVVFIQFVLGAALGYLSIKALKYIAAMLGVLALGSVLSAWSLGGDSSIYPGLEGAMPLLREVVTALGVLTIGPVAAGFAVGAVVALLRR